MSEVWLPNTGKKCFASGWQTPSYMGVDPTTHEGDLGLRLDHWIVIDCDSTEAMHAWLTHIDKEIGHTWVRKTPNGWHFFYRRTVDTYGVKPGKYPSIHLAIDVKAGMGHQVAYYVVGESRVDLTTISTVIPFNPAWLPERDQQEWAGDEWAEMPDGIGDNAMISFAGQFRRWGMDEATICQCLAAVSAVTMTENPMPIKTLKRLARQAAKWNPDAAKTVLCPGCGKEVETR